MRIHHLPSAHDGRLSGDVALETRRVSGTPSREAVLTLLSGSATVTQRIAGAVDLLVSARSTYIDQLLQVYTRRNPSVGDDALFPPFHDVLVKIGREWTPGWSAEAIGFTTRDAMPQPANASVGTRPRVQGAHLAG